jgi:hypothetical protein
LFAIGEVDKVESIDLNDALPSSSVNLRCIQKWLCRVQSLVTNTRQLSGVQPNPQLELGSDERLDH